MNVGFGTADADVQLWWTWSWQEAEEAHDEFLASPPADRGSVKVKQRCPLKWERYNRWVYPKLLDLVPQTTATYFANRGITGHLHDQVQDVLLVLFKNISPGGWTERSKVQSDIQNPMVCHKPQQALTEMDRFWNNLRRAMDLDLAVPDKMNLYRAFESIFFNIFDHTEDKQMSLQWTTLKTHWVYLR